MWRNAEPARDTFLCGGNAYNLNTSRSGLPRPCLGCFRGPVIPCATRPKKLKPSQATASAPGQRHAARACDERAFEIFSCRRSFRTVRPCQQGAMSREVRLCVMWMD